MRAEADPTPADVKHGFDEIGRGEQYQSWQQVGGYFDGDGNVGVEVVVYLLRFKLRFSDTWRPQVQTIKSFLNNQSIRTTKMWCESNPGRHDAFRIDVIAVRSVLDAGKAMLPFCAKKAEDLRIMIDYLEGRITGNQAIARYNEEVRIGRRSGFLRRLTLPLTRPQGLRVKEEENARKAREAYAVNVGEETQRQIRKDHGRHRLSFVKLSKKYGYSVSVIRRVLGAR